MSALLKVQGLQAGYGKVPVLHGINLEVAEGEQFKEILKIVK